MKNLLLVGYSRFLILLLLASVLVVMTPDKLSAQCSTPCISFQGVLKDANGVPVPDGQQMVKFSMYSEASGGVSLPLNGVKWEEEANIDVQGGIFSHYLGSIHPLDPKVFNGGHVFLNINVRGKDLLPRTQLTYAPFAYSVASAGTVVCSGALGDVKYSILEPAMFRHVNGDCWVPMDGRFLGSDDMLKTMKTPDGTRIYPADSIPNAGGLFLRSQDFTRDPMADNSGGNAWRVKNGSDNDPGRSTDQIVVQSDDVKPHNHSMLEAGEHQHGLDDNHNGTSDYYGLIYYNGEATLDNGPDDSNGEPNLWATPKRFDDLVTELAGRHTHAINNSTGSETRPKNLNLWVYIRIN